MPGTVTTTEFYSSTDSSEAQPNGARSLTQAGSPASARAYRTELSPVSFLRRSAYVFPDKVAIVHGERRTTYREFDQRVNRLASALRAAGVEPGDRVAFLAPNIPALLEAHYGVPAAGAVLVAINTRLGRDEIDVHPRPLGRADGVLRPRARRPARRHRPSHRPDRRHRSAGGSVRAVPRGRLAGALRARPRRRGGRDLDQLHLGHDRAAPRASCTRIAARI